MNISEACAAQIVKQMNAPKSARIMCVATASVSKIEIGETGEIMNEAPTTIPARVFSEARCAC